MAEEVAAAAAAEPVCIAADFGEIPEVPSAESSGCSLLPEGLSESTVTFLKIFGIVTVVTIVGGAAIAVGVVEGTKHDSTDAPSPTDTTTSNATTIATTTIASTTIASTTIASTTIASTTIASTTIAPTTTTTVTTTTTTAFVPCSGMQWNASGITVAGTGVNGSSATQLSFPWNIFIDSSNTLYIADSGNHRIQRWLQNAPSGTTIAGTGLPGSSAMQFNTPKDVYVDVNSNLYVADALNNRVQYFANGNTNGVTVIAGLNSGQIWGLQVAGSNIYACDFNNERITKNGTAVTGANQLNMPQGLAVDTTTNIGTIYVANTDRHTIVQFSPGNPSGTVVVGSHNVLGSSNTLLAYPVTLKLDQQSNLFVVDNNNHRIQLYCQNSTISPTGRTIAGTGAAGATSTTLHYPAGIALDSAHNLYVSDTSNHRVQKFMRIV